MIWTFLVVLAMAAPAFGQNTRRARTTPPAEVTDGLIVRFHSDRGRGPNITRPDAARLGTLGTRAGAALTHSRMMSGEGHVLKLPSRRSLRDVEDIAARLRADPDVLSAEPDHRVHITATPNDTNYAVYQWHYREPSFSQGGVNLPAAWDITTGNASIVIAVLDTGIRGGHADFSGRTVPGYDFIADIPTANDGGGRDSDPTDPGDWTADDECGVNIGAQDSSWHGTHVAGTVGAATNNSAHVAGVNWTSKILPVRVLGKCGGYLSDIVDGMRWSAGLAVGGVPNNANPAKVLNMSLSGAFSCSGTAYESAITDITNAGAVIIVSAGNDNVNITGASPAGCAGVISVAAVGSLGEKASYSNFGNGVTIAAPGGNGAAVPGGYVWSTFNTGTSNPVASPGGDNVVGYQGTSQAAPHVAGIAGLLLSLNPNLTPAQIKTIITTTKRTFPTGTGSDCTTSTCGAGIVNALAALQSIPSVPVVNSALTATGQVGVAFSYTITGTNSPTSFSQTGLPAGLSLNTSNGVISGTPSVAATTNVTIRAINAGGTGSATLVLTVNPPTPAITSSLTASGTVGVPFSYTITATNNPTSFSQTGLPAGLSLNTSNGVISGTPSAAAATSVTIRATNAGGTGAANMVITISPPTPAIISALTATAQVGIPFNYNIVASNNPTSYAAPGLPNGLNLNTGTGLISGTPTTTAITNVTISATNAVGTGSATLVITVNPPPPAILGTLNAGAQTGTAFSYSISASNNPTSYGATGLPAGLSINTGNGVISGTPSASGTSAVSISATNVSGTGSAVLIITATPPPVPPVSAVPTMIGATSITANWSNADGNIAGTQYFAERAVDAGFSQGLVNSGWTTAHSFTFAALPANTQYYFHVRARNSFGTMTGYVALPPAATLSRIPVAAAATGVTQTAMNVNWTSTDGNPAGTEYYTEWATDSGFTQNLGNSGWTIAYTAALAGLNANTRYYARVKSRNFDGAETSATDLPAVATLANAPATADTMSATYSSITVRWTSPPGGASGFRVEASPNAGFTAPVLTNTTADGAATSLGIDNLNINTVYYLRVASLNQDGSASFVTAGSTLTLNASASSQTVTNSGIMTVNLVPLPDAAPQITSVQVQVPPGSFPSGTNLNVTTGVSFKLPPPTTNQGRLTPLDPRIGVEITASGLQPTIPLIITMNYDPASLGTGDPRTLQMASYSAGSDQWSMLPTNVDTKNRTIMALTPHLSLFAPFFVTAGADLAAVQVFPQPWEIGDASSSYWAPTLLFTNLPAEASVRLFTITGELLWEDRSSQGGVLSWNGNKPGGKAASGTYIAIIESQGRKHVRRVVLIR